MSLGLFVMQDYVREISIKQHSKLPEKEIHLNTIKRSAMHGYLTIGRVSIGAFCSQGDHGLPGEVGAPGVSGVGEPGPKVSL